MTSLDAVSCDPVGRSEIAERLRVQVVTVDKWRERYPAFPAHRWTVGGVPVWEWEDVAKWAAETGRKA